MPASKHRVFDLSAAEALVARAIAEAHGGEADAIALALFDAVGEGAAFSLAEDNEVASHIGHALLEAGIADEHDPRWREAHEATDARISAYLAELDRMAELLAVEGITLIALKNAGIARALHPCAGCSPMGDVDVLVDPADFRRAHRLLIDSGYEFKFRSPLEEAEIEAAEAAGGGEYHIELVDGGGLWFELQWRPVAGRWIQPHQEPAAAELIERSLPIDGSATRILAPEDNLLQVALHTAKHTYVRAPGFRLHTDVDRIVGRQVIDWDVFLERTRDAAVKTPVYFSLAVPAMLMDTPVPEAVLDELRPAGWKVETMRRWLQAAGLFGPNERKFSRARYLMLNALLYDSTANLARAVFPDREAMRERYEVGSDWLLPVYHARRLFDLALRRNRT